jgi:hypothetical protein
VNLRAQAALDLVAILSDEGGGFAWPIDLTNPEGVTVALTGFSTDIGQTIDPETGQVVTGRRASVALSTSILEGLGIGIPRGISDSRSKPWVVRFPDIHGVAQTFKVQEAMPDRALGIVTCMLETYRG